MFLLLSEGIALAGDRNQARGSRVRELLEEL